MGIRSPTRQSCYPAAAARLALAEEAGDGAVQELEKKIEFKSPESWFPFPVS